MPAKRTCDCGTCKKCKWRAYMNDYYRRDPQRVRDYVKASRERRIEAVREYDRKRGHRVYDVAKEKCRQKYNAAVKSGKLQHGPCEVCGNPKTDGHHEDYTKPFDVRWLCRVHHMELHRTVA